MNILTNFLKLIKRSDSQEKGQFANDYSDNLDKIDEAVEEISINKIDKITGEEIEGNIPVIDEDGGLKSGEVLLSTITEELANLSDGLEGISESLDNKIDKIVGTEGNIPVIKNSGLIDGEVSLASITEELANKVDLIDGEVGNIVIIGEAGLLDGGANLSSLVTASDIENIQTELGNKIDKIDGGTGNFPLIDEGGGLTNSEYSPESFATASELLLKADITYVDTALASKINIIDGTPGNIPIIDETGNLIDGGIGLESLITTVESIEDELGNKIGIVEATEDNFASFTETGTIKDSGYSHLSFAPSNIEFIDLPDTPESYENQRGKAIVVNEEEDGLVFTDFPTGGGGASKFIDLIDTPQSYSGAGGKVVAVKPTQDGLEFIDAPSGGGDGVGGAIYLYYSLKGGL